MLLLIGMQLLAGVLILGLYHLRRWLGLTLLFVFVAATQVLSNLLVTTTSLPLGNGLQASPGSAILFAAGLMAVTLVYLREGVPATRRLIYGLIIANTVVGLASGLVQWGLTAGALQGSGGAHALVGEFSVVVFLTGTLFLLLDAFVVAMLVEALPRRGRASRWALGVLPLLLVLLLDGALVSAAWFRGEAGAGEMAAGHLLGKLCAGLVMGHLLWIYLRLTAGQGLPPRGPGHGQGWGGDLFELFTYRERYARLREEYERQVHLQKGWQEEMEGRLVESQRQLEQAQRMESLGQLTGGIAHDFNNILQVITGCGHLLGRELRTHPSAAALLGDMLKAAGRAERLTAQLLAFGRRQVLSPEPVDLNELVRESSQLFTHMLGEQIRIDLQLEEELPLVSLDRAQWEQVLVNLVLNARDAMPAGGHLVVRTTRREIGDDVEGVPPGLHVSLVVADDGEGMHPEIADRIFEPFFTTKARGRGTGLGLSMVHGIVRQSGGHIRLESAPGQGAQFEILLPAGATVGPVAAPAPGLGLGLEGTRVLVVEDEAGVRRFLVAALESMGLEVLEAADAEGGRQEFRGRARGQLDLLVSDVILPGASGPDLARELRDEQPGLPVLFLSGYSESPELDAMLSLPGVDFLPKPCGADEIEERVRVLLARAAAGPTLDSEARPRH